MKDIEDPREVNHPRLTRRLLGHEAGEQRLLAAWGSGRMHHAWLLAGPRGIGKATLAYRFARFLFTHPDAAGDAPRSLDVPPDAPAAALVAARSHPDLLVVERTIDEKKERLRSQVRVEDAREVSHFFSLTPAMGGWRVCIVDAADDLNSESANSLLKVLEEPPSRSVFLIVAHAPGRLLATIRSRSIRLDLKPLDTEQVVEAMQALGSGDKSSPDELAAIAALSQGSPGRAVNLVGSQGAKLFLKFQEVAGKKPPFARGTLLEIAGHMKRLDAAEDFPVFSDLMADWVATTAKARAVAGGAVAAQPWARAHQDIGHSIRRANALNLDRRQVLLEAFSSIEEAARLGQS
ncbi:MAG TPA: DNA polymerase III subunit delta' [Aestuariivirgaceae bacterium]|nr:DNA polymerase III subunit delta' [Aestuariivirgaceae bacterium]